MPTWNNKESQQEKENRLRKERRDEVLQASAEAIEEIDRLLGSCMEVVSPTHPLKEHYHGTESDEVPGVVIPHQDRLEDQ